MFHCTAGKDRTGYGALLFLSIMGVKKEIIIEYLIVLNGELAGMGAQSYSKGTATDGSEEAAKYQKKPLQAQFLVDWLAFGISYQEFNNFGS